MIVGSPCGEITILMRSTLLKDRPHITWVCDSARVSMMTVFRAYASALLGLEVENGSFIASGMLNILANTLELELPASWL